MASAELRDDDDCGPLTHLDDFEDVSTNVSEFAQVVFHGVQECYPPGNVLKCNFTLTTAIKPHSRDWIGVFKVGWTSTRQYRAFEWAPYPVDRKEGQELYQEITFNAYYLPKEEDGEYYQLCYIDSTGKMRGASTPFQFLEQSADDFIQIVDESMDILMIHNKTEFCEEELKRAQEEKQEMEEECFALKDKVVTMEIQLKEANEQLEKITKECEVHTTSSQSREESLASLQMELSDARQKVAVLADEAGNYERSLQQTEGAFMEVVNRELALRNKLDGLEKKYAQILEERLNLKAKLETAEKNNLDICEEIDNLKQLLSQSNETHQTIRESENRMKEEFVKVQHELQLAASEKENYQILESRLASAEESRTLLSKELESLKMVQEKLSRDLVIAKTEKEALKVAKDRQSKDFNEEKRKMQLHSHQNREKQALLQEQISALKDGIQQLAQEKEMASKGTKGSLEAQQIATRDLKDKVRRAQFQCKEEVRRRGELQKKLISTENRSREEKNELRREVEDLRMRLQMGAEEYKKIYTERRQLENRLEKRKLQKDAGAIQSTSLCDSASPAWKDKVKDLGSIGRKDEEQIQASVSSMQTSVPDRSSQAIQAASEHTTQSVQATASQSTQGNQISNFASQVSQASTNLSCQGSQATTSQTSRSSQAASGGAAVEKATQSGLPAPALHGEGALVRAPSRDDTFDLREMHDQMCEMAQELDERKKEVGKVQRLYQEERETSKHRESVWRLKYESLERKNEDLQEKLNKMLNDYTNMKHSYEILKFDVESQREEAASPAPNEIRSTSRPMQFVNPYAQPSGRPISDEMETHFGNPYVSLGASTDQPIPDHIRHLSIDSVADNVPSLRYPPGVIEDAILSDASDSIPPSRLPEPLKPDVLPAGKIAAIKMVSSQTEPKTGDTAALQEHTDDEREDAQFVDAQEFPEVPAPSVADASPPAAVPTMPLEPKKCPECVIEFPPTYPEEDFVKHVQRHFAKLCPVCQGLLDPQISNVDFQRHVEHCLTKNE